MCFQLFCIFLLITAAKCVQMVNGDTATQANDPETEILYKCLTSAADKTPMAERLQKVARYSKWTDEEIPCFTRCIAHEKGWFSIELNKWKKQQLVDELGADMYNYCRFELDRYEGNGCEFAHKGLRCLKQAELHTVQTYTSLLHCANELNVSMSALQQYAHFPDQEAVPCLFQCFAERMNFYTPTYAWNFDNWLNAFGPMKQDRAASAVCKASAEDMAQRDKCAWMYAEYVCLERLNYNTDGSSVETSTFSIMASRGDSSTAASTEESTEGSTETNAPEATENQDQ